MSRHAFVFIAALSTGACGQAAPDSGLPVVSEKRRSQPATSAAEVETVPPLPVADHCGTTKQQSTRIDPDPFCDVAANRQSYVGWAFPPLRLKVHIVRDGGTGAMAAADVPGLLSAAEVFLPPEMSLTLHGTVDYIDQSALFEISGEAEYQTLIGIRPEADAIDVYIVSDGPWCGRATDIGPNGAGGSDALVMRAGCGSPTLAHEIGHLLGLFHTHEPQPLQCDVSGDMCCDTAFDPGDCAQNEETCEVECPDSDDDHVNTNLLSYYACGDEQATASLSTCQRGRMLCHLARAFEYATAPIPVPTCQVDDDCDDSNPCTTDSCFGGLCDQFPATGLCSDNNECTVGDACDAGACTPGAPRNCDDDNPKTQDSCHPQQGCQHKVTWICTPGATTKQACGSCQGSRTMTCNASGTGWYAGPCVETCRPVGQLCGLNLNGHKGLCKGHDPKTSCPFGYSKVLTKGSGGDKLYSCARTLAANCIGSKCKAAKMAKHAVCGMAHNGNDTGFHCAGVMPSPAGCAALGMKFSGYYDYGSPAGIGVGTCVATSGTRPRDGLSCWTHSKASSPLWCTFDLNGCPGGTQLVGKADWGAPYGHGWQTCNTL